MRVESKEKRRKSQKNQEVIKVNNKFRNGDKIWVIIDWHVAGALVRHHRLAFQNEEVFITVHQLGRCHIDANLIVPPWKKIVRSLLHHVWSKSTTSLLDWVDSLRKECDRAQTFWKLA
jgi:hypothetical protein